MHPPRFRNSEVDLMHLFPWHVTDMQVTDKLCDHWCIVRVPYAPSAMNISGKDSQLCSRYCWKYWDKEVNETAEIFTLYVLMKIE